MSIRTQLLLSLFFLSAFFSFSSAHSQPPPPVRRAHIVAKSSLQILPRAQAPCYNPLTRARSLLPPITPPPSDLLHSDTILLTVSIPNALHHEAFLLLRPTEMFHPDAKQVSANGQTAFLRADDWRLYSGEVIAPNWVSRALSQESMRMQGGKGRIGKASIMVHRSGDGDISPLFEGSFKVYGETYNIVLREKYDKMRQPADALIQEMGEMVVFRDSDMEHSPNAHGCGHDSLSHNTNSSHPVWQNRHSPTLSTFSLGVDGLRKRQGDVTGGMEMGTNFLDTIGNTEGCPKTPQIVYMGVALDCSYVAHYGGPDQARTQVLNTWNQVSAIYRSTFNVSLGIIELLVSDQTCSNNPSTQSWNIPCERNLQLDERLSAFSQWRGDKGADGAGLWHMMSNCATDVHVGVAWLGAVCQSSANSQSDRSIVSGTGVSTSGLREWATVAHEIGHNFGAIHDCDRGCSLTGDCCPFARSTCNANSAFIMSPTNAKEEKDFSACSIGNICSNIGTRAITTSCIQSPGGRPLVSLQQCGNGIVEPENGEDCDPGQSNSTCCDPQTCKFRQGAVCDPSSSACCTGQCQFASAGTVCRPSVDSTCDIEDTCTGTSGTCPADKTEPDGKSCGSNGLACASGRCTSLNQQCSNSGRSMGLNTACGQRGDTSCVVSCRDPRNSNACIVLQTPLMDGSPCGYGGHCYNQTCQAGAWQSRFQELYRQNLQISIPVTIVVGLLVLAILFFLTRAIFRCCSGTAGGRRSGGFNTAPLRPPPMRQSVFAQPPPPPPAHARTSGYGEDPNGYAGVGNRQSQYGQNGNWVDESQWNGPNYGHQQVYGGGRY